MVWLTWLAFLHLCLIAQGRLILTYLAIHQVLVAQVQDSRLLQVVLARLAHLAALIRRRSHVLAALQQ